MTIFKPDIVTFITKEGMELRQRGKYFWGLCPFHQEKTPSFKVDSERQTFHCFGCGRHGDVITFVEGFRGLSFPDALSYLKMEGCRKVIVDSPEMKARAAEKALREWIQDYRRFLLWEVWVCNRAELQVKTEEDFDEMGELFTYRTDLEYQLEILNGEDINAKRELIKQEQPGLYAEYKRERHERAKISFG